MRTYYNEFAPYPAQWLRNLFTDADVDERSICDVGIDDVATYDRVHLFAGIGGWEYALQLAMWPHDLPVWTGSCPCQPFSCAGTHRNGDSTSDPRHLWPEMFRLIAGNRPAIIFGEQVASKPGLEWFDGVRTDLDGIGYTCGMAVLPAASVGSPHRRERLFWVADTYGQQRDVPIRRAAAETAGRNNHTEHTQRRGAAEPQRAGAAAPWASFQSVLCEDGQLRRIEPGVFPLAPRVPGDVERLRSYGNSVIPQVAAVFIQSYMEARSVFY